MADDAFLSHLIGTSEHLGDVRERCAWLGPLRPTVALVGESGTGKTLVARELHERGGPRRPFVRVSLSRLGHSLVDGELLGHAKGAFTGADRPHVGFLEQAQGGSLVLDDFQDACERAQALLLEFADRQGQVALMGTRGWRPDARIIVVTQVPLAELAKDTVRADLIYRLDDVSIHLLPLREHMEDLPALVPHLLGQVAQELGLPLPHLADPLLDALARYTWPGNVRELEHALKHATVQASFRSCRQCALRPECRMGCERCVALARDLPTALHELSARPPRRRGAPLDRERCKELMTLMKGNMSAAAKEAQRSRTTFWRTLRRFDIDPAPFRTRAVAATRSTGT